jgi:hypothetical protein
MKVALRKRFSLDFTDTPLRNVVDFLNENTDLSFAADPRALRDRPAVTLRARDIALADALSQMLRSTGLRAAATDYAVLITTKDQFAEITQFRASRRLCAYNVSALQKRKVDMGPVVSRIRSMTKDPRAYVAECGPNIVAIVPSLMEADLDALFRKPLGLPAPKPKRPRQDRTPAPKRAAPAETAKLDVSGLHKDRETVVILKDGTSVTGKLFSASPRHVSLLIDGKLRGFKADAVERVTQEE